MAKLKKVLCKNCKRAIYRSVGRVNENFKLGNNFYCSRKCESEYKTKRKKLICENCGKPFKRELSQISAHNFCSQSCAAIANNKKFPKRKAKMRACIKYGRQFLRRKGYFKYCSTECKNKAQPRPSLQGLIKIIRTKTQELGRVPTRRELKNINDSCRKLFGSWNNAVLAAGFTPNRSHDNRMYKRANAKAIDGHLCDSVSELIIDNWLTKNKIPHERNMPYPKTNHKADWGINLKGQVIFVEYFGLANDSSRYDRSIKKKKDICRKYKIKLIGIYPKDLYPKEFLEDNLKNKFKKILIA